MKIEVKYNNEEFYYKNVRELLKAYNIESNKAKGINNKLDLRLLLDKEGYSDMSFNVVLGYCIKCRTILSPNYEEKTFFDDKDSACEEFYKMYKRSKRNWELFDDNGIDLLDLQGEPSNTVYKEIGVYGYDLNGYLYTIHKFKLRTAYDEIMSCESIAMEEFEDFDDTEEEDWDCSIPGSCDCCGDCPEY